MLQILKRKRSLSFRSNMELLLLCIPTLLLVIVVRYIPMGGLLMAFEDFNAAKGIIGSKFIGLKNFTFFFKSQDLWIVIRNTIGYNLTFIILGTFCAIAVALLMDEIVNRSALKVYQTIMFFPYFLSWTVGSYIVLAFLDPYSGMVNELFSTIGLKTVSWYTEPKYWPFIFVIANLWKGIGASSVVYYAGLTGINSEYYEAARIDGANSFQIVTKIKIPLLAPLICILLIMSVGGIFHSDFGLFYIVPQGGGTSGVTGVLRNVTLVADTYVYSALKDVGDVGMATAAGLCQSLMGFVLVLLANFTVRKISEENSLF